VIQRRGVDNGLLRGLWETHTLHRFRLLAALHLLILRERARK
jgi:hypothetical protein